MTAPHRRSIKGPTIEKNYLLNQPRFSGWWTEARIYSIPPLADGKGKHLVLTDEHECNWLCCQWGIWP